MLTSSQAGWCGVCTDVVAPLIYRGEEGAKLKDEALDLLIEHRSNVDR